MNVFQLHSSIVFVSIRILCFEMCCFAQNVAQGHNKVEQCIFVLTKSALILLISVRFCTFNCGAVLSSEFYSIFSTLFAFGCHFTVHVWIMEWNLSKLHLSPQMKWVKELLAGSAIVLGLEQVHQQHHIFSIAFSGTFAFRNKCLLSKHNSTLREWFK